MKKSLYFSAAALLSLGVAATACSDEDFGYTKDQLQEAKNFREVFGEPDPDHTWSTADYRYISVNVQYPAFFDSYQCRVWTADPSRTKKNLYYMADLRVENGQTSKVGIDCPADLQTVYVSLTDPKGGTLVMPATFDKEGNASVVFGEMTRANVHLDVVNAEKGIDFDVDVYYHNKNAANNTDWEEVLPAGSDGWGYFPKSKYDSFIKVFPENGGNTANPPCSSFVFESKGEDLVLYPFYAVTDGINTNKIVFWVYNPADGTSYSDIVKNYEPTVLMPAGSMEVLGKAPGSFANYTEMYRASYGTTDTKSRPYIIHGVPAGWRIIFALETSSEGYFYSIKELNDPANSKSQQTVDRSKFTNGETYSMAGTATIGADTYLAFEDTWYEGMYDCQDMAFAVYGAKAVDMNAGGGEAMGFVVAYEDLGSTFDMDYNDIVLRVEHVTNSLAAQDAEKDVTVSLLAAGGTIPVVPMYKNAAIFAGKGADTGSTGEAHTVFGVSTDTPVNAGGSTASATPVNSTIRVKEISPITTVAADIVMNLNDDKQMKYTNPQAWGVTHPEDGNHTDKIPYAILISDPNWQWPSEHTLISSVYPGFKTWVTNHSTAQDWYAAEWQRAEIGVPSGEVVGIVANTTFYESQSIANINPEFLDDYCTNGTTLHFVFENATVGGTFTVKSENALFSKDGIVEANGRAQMEITGDEFKKILYKNGTDGDKNTYYTITVFASKYGVSFGSEAEFHESDINGTNVFADLIAEDGTEVELGTSDAGNPSIEASYFTQFADVTFTIRSTNFVPGAAITELNNSYKNIIEVCGNDGYLTSAVTAIAGRPGIYRISVTSAEFAKFLSNESGSGIQFKGFTNLKVAVAGKYAAGLTASNLTLGCNKSNIDLVANGTITSNSAGAISITTESDKVTINGTSISTGSVSEVTVVTLNINQAAEGNYAAGETTMTLTIDPSAKDVNDLAVTTVGLLTMNAKETKQLNDCTTAPIHSGSGTGAFSYSSSNTDVITVDASTGAVTAKNVAEESTAYVLISQAEDGTYAASGALQYVKVTVVPAAKTDLQDNTSFDVSLNQSLSFGGWLNCEHAAFISMDGYSYSGVSDATITFTVTTPPNAEQHVIYADCSERIEANYKGYDTSWTLVLTNAQLQKALSVGGIYVAATEDKYVGISKAVITLGN